MCLFMDPPLLIPSSFLFILSPLFIPPSLYLIFCLIFLSLLPLSSSYLPSRPSSFLYFLFSIPLFLSLHPFLYFLSSFYSFTLFLSSISPLRCLQPSSLFLSHSHAHIPSPTDTHTIAINTAITHANPVFISVPN